MSNYTETKNTTFGTSSPTTLTAFFEDRDDAAAAVERLIAAGVNAADVRLAAGNGSSSDTSALNDDKGFWGTLEDFFFPDDDRAAYAEGLRRGGFLVTVSGLSPALYDTALDILDDEGSIDLDERAASWKSEGWTPETYSGASSGATTSRDISASTSVRDDEVIPVVEEELRVGKRDVNAGRVKVRAYTAETPVSEQVTLRNENVTIERRTVDRALDGTEDAFRDRTIEAEEFHEEAVVSKETRVVEEIALRKTSEQRDETISDSIRKTEVEIEDDRGTDAKRPITNS